MAAANSLCESVALHSSLFTLHSSLKSLHSSLPTWIWYPGDFEVWLGNIFNNRRTERGAMFPPFWKQDSHYVTVEFSREFDLSEEETITIACEGQYNFALDGKLLFPSNTYTIPAGKHKLNIKVWNQATPPALFISGTTIHTDSSWLATYEDKLWIDENGIAHGSGIYVPAASWNFNSPDTPPSTYHLNREEHRPVSSEVITAATTAATAAVPASSPSGSATVPPASATVPDASPSGPATVPPASATVPDASPSGPATAPPASATVPDASPSGVLYDFGRETFGYLKVKALKGTLHVYYGESREEALDKEHCETLDVVNGQRTMDNGPLAAQEKAEVNNDQLSIVNCQLSKAFRFVFVVPAPGTTYDEVLMDYEFSPTTATVPDGFPSGSGSFRCSDDELNRIWDVAAYTMDLTTREFFMDGIKRDRWTWSGDAIQSYLMNYYLRFDTECVKRTIRQLRGKDPVTAHVNTIMDYTFYWFKSILDYYEYTADVSFVREMWPRMVTLMDYVLSRTTPVPCGSSATSSPYDTSGMAEGQPDDWIFVDWVDFPMHKRGTLCFEQVLFCKALEVMAECQALLSQQPECLAVPPQGSDSLSTHLTYDPTAETAVGSPDYAVLAATLRAKINAIFWDNDRHAFLHAIENDAEQPSRHLNPQVTKFPNMFAILYGLADADQRQAIMQHVMLNPAVDPITTPYMRFYELETLCMDGHQEQVTKEMKAYWGGMLREGATSFWEKYVPSESGTQHLAMYGRPYGKSLCHAWGASPIYIIGKYYLGVQPTKPGYEEYEVRPCLGGLDWIEGTVPTPHGMISVRMDRQQVTVHATEGTGWLIVADQRVRIDANQEVVIQISGHK